MMKISSPMKLLKLFVLIGLLTSCASGPTVDRKSYQTYLEVINNLRFGEFHKAKEILDESPIQTFEFFVKYSTRKPIYFANISKQDLKNGIDKIEESLDKCEGNKKCFEKLRVDGFGLSQILYHSEFKNISVFDGDVLVTVSGKKRREDNLNTLIDSYIGNNKERFAKIQQTKRDKVYRKEQDRLDKQYANDTFKKCLTSYSLEKEKRNEQVIHRNYGISSQTRAWKRNPELYKRAYRIEVQNSKTLQEHLTEALRKQSKVVSSKECSIYQKEYSDNHGSYLRRLRNEYDF
ncbi:hypothetical protein [Halobacteriovorax sp. BALOs_7]|uniref:hypothetical protein n=1 Tax=Halobacteriovorax sp. BALOs_7 TaxID=2109558 RepID=UPI0013C4B96D|nr:hypothetical protein [Halobacteriovorax sp. BALOs_7]